METRMAMPSFNEIMGVIVAVILGLCVQGRGDLVWKAIGEVRQVAISNARKDWGCPSIFAGKSACNSYDPNRYR